MSGNSIGGTCGEVKASPEPQVRAEMGYLDKSVLALAESIIMLQDKLGPIVVHQIEEKDPNMAGVPEEPLCMIATEIRENRYKIRNMIKAVQDLTEGVQV